MAKPKVLLAGMLLLISLLAIGVLASACKGPEGPAGATGPAGPTGAAAASTGKLSGTVTNSLNKAPVSGAEVTVDPAVPNVTITTGNDGKFEATLPIGTYAVTIKKANFDNGTATASVVAGQTITRDVVLKAKAPVVVSAAAQTGDPGATVSLKATVALLDGSTISGYKWTQVSGTPATISGGTSDTLSVKLADATAYKDHLIEALVTENRFGVQAINPHALTDAKTSVFQVAVTTSSGTYKAKVNATANLPFAFSTGIDNVPINVPVLLSGKGQAAYNWSVTAPDGSAAALDSASVQHPVFTPAAKGKYTVTETNSGATFDVFAGAYVGVITGVDAETRDPIPSTACTGCHNGTIAPDKFTDWKASGHAEIFTQNIEDPNGHWSINCASCHTVGYNPGADNGGFDEAVAKEKWTVPAHGEVGLFTKILKTYPETAKLSNIQCENCHGPQDSPAHMQGAPRVDISANVCGSCHGEPLRHGRFQQWEESGHSGIESSATPERGVTNAHCGRCHSGQGFLAWIAQGDLTKQIQGANGNATKDELAALGMTADEIQPVTCTVCHDPHAEGNLSGEPNATTVRISGSTSMLPSGFVAAGVGRGAMCITCHNSRNGQHNDIVGDPTSYSAPHTASQGDVLMGENAYFMVPGDRSAHSYVEDTCATCHMEKTPPPAEFSYNLAGTNHSFKASKEICADCHGETIVAENVQHGVEAKVHDLADAMAAYLLGKMGNQVHIKDYTPHQFEGKSYDVKSNDVTIDKTNIAAIEPTEPHGQQGYLITFKSPVSVTYARQGENSHTLQLTETEVQLGDITTDGTAKLIPAGDLLVKAGWNYFLIHGDGSEGVHNPKFSLEVLNTTIAVLELSAQ